MKTDSLRTSTHFFSSGKKDSRSISIKKFIYKIKSCSPPHYISLSSDEFIDANSKRKLLSLLDLWVYCFFEIEKKTKDLVNEIDLRDPEIYSLIGQSFCILNDFNSIIISKISPYVDDNNTQLNEKDKTDLKPIIKYFKFFNNLSASKIKYFFFRETPVKNINYPFIKIDRNLTETGFDLIHHLSSKKIEIDRIKAIVTNFCFLQELIYSFAYSQEKNKGVFLKFKFDHVFFNKISDNVIKAAQAGLSPGESSNIMHFLVQVGYILFGSYVNHYKGKKIFDFEKTTFNKNTCYELFYDIAISNRDIHIEPITYHLYDILWKISGMIDISPKSHDYSENRKILTAELLAFVEGYIEKGKALYENNCVSFSELYSMGERLIVKPGKSNDDSIYDLIFRENPVKNTRSTFEKIKAMGGNETELFFITDSKTETETETKKIIISLLRKNNESEYKIDKLIQIFTPLQIIRIFYSYSKLINNSIGKDHSAFVGFYRSGIFLGHILNIFKEQAERTNIWLFNARPYVATHPVHVHHRGDCSELNNIILLDDSIKTGFTYKLYKSYILRNMYEKDFNIKLFTIFDFSYFERINDKNSDEHISLFTLNKNKFIEYNDGKLLDEHKIKSIKYIHKDIEKILRILNTDQQYKPIGIDLSFLLTDTDILITICEKFLKEILKRNNQKKRICLYAPSANGDVLLLMCAFILKTVNDYKHYKFTIVDKDYKKNDDFLVAIDISIASGFSLLYNWKTLFTNEYSLIEKDMSEINKIFDLVAVVYYPHSSTANFEDIIFSLNHKGI